MSRELLDGTVRIAARIVVRALLTTRRAVIAVDDVAVSVAGAGFCGALVASRIRKHNCRSGQRHRYDSHDAEAKQGSNDLHLLHLLTHWFWLNPLATKEVALRPHVGADDTDC